ncbi:MAG: hypothetical protein ACREOG_13885, partial [Gemmatimonadaceae bacterium]
MIPAAGLEAAAKLAGCDVLIVRQLGATLEAASLGGPTDISHSVARYRNVVEQVFGERPIVPLPCGTAFR